MRAFVLDISNTNIEKDEISYYEVEEIKEVKENAFFADMTIKLDIRYVSKLSSIPGLIVSLYHKEGDKVTEEWREKNIKFFKHLQEENKKIVKESLSLLN